MIKDIAEVVMNNNACVVNMKCGNCKHCKPNDVCNGDCLCDALDIDVSEEDDTRFYSKHNNKLCELFIEKETTS